MKKIFSPLPTSILESGLLKEKTRFWSASWRGLRVFSPMVVAFALAVLYFWLLSPSTPAYADLADNVISVGLDTKSSRSVAWGDMDGDGDLDLAVGNVSDVNQVYLNEGGILASTPAWQSTVYSFTRSVAWGDMDGDGDLDLAVGNFAQANQVYLNEGGTLEPHAAWRSTDNSWTMNVAWGDVDGDGDLDLAVGNDGQVNQLYLNQGGTLAAVPAWESTGNQQNTYRVAWGDMDGDGDLDLAVGNRGQANQVYLNQGGSLQNAPTWTSTDTKGSTSVAWGDVNGDGHLDLAVGNYGDVNQVYLNHGGTLENLPTWQSTGDEQATWSVAWGDMDSDGDLDLAVGNAYGDVNQVYLNESGTLGAQPAWVSADSKDSRAVAWADIDGDGDLELAVGNQGDINQVYLNESSALALNAAWDSTGDPQESKSVAWGDMDGDGDLDLAVANVNEVNQVYLNDGHGHFTSSWQSSDSKDSQSLAWGDVDGDGDLDLAVGNSNQVNQLYLNEGSTLANTPAWQSIGDEQDSRSVAWGDMDGDGDLDLVVGNYGQPNQLYLNEGGSLASQPAWESSSARESESVAWGDMDGDGDLDLAVGNHDDVNEIYLNDGGTLQEEPVWQSTDDEQATRSVAWGDLDGDGDLDLAIGNYGQLNQVYLNEGGTFSKGWQSTGDEKLTLSVAWGDMDGDGDLDLAVGNTFTEVNQVYLNERGTLASQPAWQSSDANDSQSVAWGDMDGDGDLDLAVANSGQVNQIFENRRQGETGLPLVPYLTVTRPDSSANADFYASPVILNDREIPITYTLFDPQGGGLERIAAHYSIDGGDNWQPAIATSDTVTRHLASSASGVTHVYTWDTFASGFFGQSDHVVLRVVAYRRPITEVVAMGGFQRPASSATTFPLRVRGTQVRVLSDSLPVANALIYRLPAGQLTGAEVMANQPELPFRTNQQGYLQGRGQLNLGDQLMALLPITGTSRNTSTSSYRLYHTSAPPTTTGLDMHSVSDSGVQELIVSADNALMLFDLDVSLEWDARNDDIFLTQLERDIKRTSEIMYDLTNGQVAFGQLRVFHAKENWLNSDIVIYAANNLRPSADLGGIITAPMSETLSSTEVITNAYLRGQVRMSAIWNRFGNPDGDVGEDWPRTLAHELGHYLLFVPDNYLGIKNGRLAKVDCQGSVMTDVYREDYSEFLTRAGWAGDCLDTLAEHTTGRTDWETVTTFYDMLDGSGGNQGPSNLPLEVSQVTFIEPETPSTTLIDPFFNLTDEHTNRLSLPFGQAQGYLFKRRGTADITDDYVRLVGSPIVDMLRVRGVEAGDRLCLFDYSHTPRRLGCVEQISASSTNLSLHEVPGWQPQITVHPVTSRTVAITVTQAITSGDLNVQLFAAAHPTTTGVITSPVALMIPIGSDTFTQTLTLDYPIANGFVRIWTTAPPLREEITEYFLSNGWGPAGGSYGWDPAGGSYGWDPAGGSYGWDPNRQRYGWGAPRAQGWQAPIVARDGQVTIFDLDHIYGGNPAYALQWLPVAPNLPTWLTQVGQAYRFSAAQELTGTLNIMFEYMEREVPAGYEEGLRVYYSPDEGLSWQRLDTGLDDGRNLASAELPGEGIYTLISTIEMPPFSPGWNNMGYPVAETRPITTALAAIEDAYTSVAHYDPSQTPSWGLYDPEVADNHPEFSMLVNDLTQLEFGHGYWIHATDAITLYLGVAESASNRSQSSSQLSLPPATFYGWVTPSASFTPTLGMTVMAHIDGNLCGQTTIEELDGQLAYKLQVLAETISGEPNGCGESGKNIVFEVAGSVTEDEQAWDNRQASFHPLSVSADATSSPQLSISSDIPVYIGTNVVVPVEFMSNTTQIASTVFSVDYDESCLAFDATDSDNDGVPDAISFNLPNAFNGSVSVDGSDNDGELDFFIADLSSPLASLPDGVLLNITFTPTCTPSVGNPISATVGFSADPLASFGNTDGQSLPGTSTNGSVEIRRYEPGDCNNDGSVDAGDVSCLVLEIFDGDGTDPDNTSGGTHAGTPGSDANQDDTIDAGDIACAVLLIFNGSCADNTPPPTASPNLSISSYIPVYIGTNVVIPVEFASDSSDSASTVFSVNYDESCLAFDSTDSDNDGVPDA
ncbi:MAG: FG-GAP-like repeat-containing protein, partial [Ardenticatenaceae bacterium]